MTGSPIPHIDLHRHIEGSVRLTTVLEMAQRHSTRLPVYDLAGLQALVFMDRPIPDIVQIFPRFDLLRSVFIDTDACRRITLECLEDAALQGLDYVELRFSPFFMAEPYGLDPLRVAASVCEAWEEGQALYPSLTARLVGILSRTYGPEGVEIELKAALANRERGIVGLDLAGDEARQPARLFARHFAKAREAGLFLTAHAGEFSGSGSVRETVELLGVHRLGHAVRAVDDPALLDLLAERRIAVECCPTSNLYTGSVASFKNHPLPVFLEHGIPCAICTDDPTLFGNLTLDAEFAIAKNEVGLSDAQIDQARRDAWEAAFLTAPEKQRILDRLKDRG